MISVQINNDEMSTIEQHPVLASILIALGVFLLSQIFSFGYNVIKTRIRRKKVRKMAEINLKMVPGYLLNKCSHFARASKAKNIHEVPFLVFGAFPSEILKEIGYQSLYDAYFGGFRFKSNKPERYKQFNFIWTLVLSVPLIETEIKAEMEKMANGYSMAKLDQGRSIDSFLKKIDRLRVDRFHNKLSQEEIHYLDGQEIIMSAWMSQQEKLSLETMHHILVMPSLELLRANPFFEFAPELSDSLTAAVGKYNESIKIHQAYCRRADESFRFYEQDLDDFETALEAFGIHDTIDPEDYNKTYVKDNTPSISN